jgi:hypothetical protein
LRSLRGARELSVVPIVVPELVPDIESGRVPLAVPEVVPPVVPLLAPAPVRPVVLLPLPVFVSTALGEGVWPGGGLGDWTAVGGGAVWPVAPPVLVCAWARAAAHSATAAVAPARVMRVVFIRSIS